MTGATAVARTSRRMPDFAGVALVDILANGVAMLIIVIVVSIAARMEREERQVEQASEVAAVMSHKFSTSLVLNSLAASPPARLHDYETSPLDQILDPEILPILELHGGFVRNFHSGRTWTRRELLREHNGFSAWAAGLGFQQRARLRVDVYDVPQFYLAMAILREHGIRVYHWHFLTGALSPGEAARCPPGVAAKDCRGGEADRPAPLPELAMDERGSGGLGGPESPLVEPPSGTGRGSGGEGSLPGFMRDGTGSAPGPMPGGVVPGMAGAAGAGFPAAGADPGSAGAGLRPDGGIEGTADAARGAGDGGAGAPGGGDPGEAGAGRGLLSGADAAGRSRGFGSEPGLGPEGAAGLGSFPDAREGGAEPSAGRRGGGSPRGGQGGSGSGRAPRAGAERGGDGAQISLRIALPESLRREARSGGEGAAPALEALFGIILHYLGGLQHSLDTGGTPSPQIDRFAERIQDAFRAPPPITEAEREVARDLALKFALLPHLGESEARPQPLAFRPAPPGPDAEAALVIAPNRLNDAVGVDRGGRGGDAGADAGADTETAEAERNRARQGDERRAGEARGGESRSQDRDRRDGALPGDGLPDSGRAALALNAYPGIWKGLEIRIEPWSVLLMPPEVREPERLRWRAVAYLTPRLDDFIVGFVFATVDPEGGLRVQADANRVRLDGRPLFTEYRESAFGSRGWLVSLYAALAIGLLLLGAARLFLAGRSRLFMAGRSRLFMAGRGRRLPAGRPA